jgi:hypothetical protein
LQLPDWINCAFFSLQLKEKNCNYLVIQLLKVQRKSRHARGHTSSEVEVPEASSEEPVPEDKPRSEEK